MGRILAVDDEENILELIQAALEGDGHQVTGAANGLEALKSVAASMPELILLDLRMPVMDGWEFASRFRARYGRDVPILVLTADRDAAASASRIDADGCLAKPFDLMELLRLVDRFASIGKSGNRRVSEESAVLSASGA
ncbi:MAG TPA: response regulator [Chloroflexota bacterium]|nr:response regulator [Chloroflexota bacterium]